MMKFSLETRDFINIGVFTAIYFVIMFATGMIGFAGPIYMFVGWALGILLNGTVFLLFLSRTPKMGAATLLGALCGLGFFVTGHPIYTLFSGLLMGFLADCVASKMAKAQKLEPKRGVYAYMVFSLFVVCSALPYIINKKLYMAQVAEEMGQAYADEMDKIFQPWVLAIWAIAVLILAYIGGMIGVKTLKKHFACAGLTATGTRKAK